MEHRLNTSRRNFLKSAAGVSFLALPANISPFVSGSAERLILSGHLDHFFRHKKSTEKIGKTILAHYPKKNVIHWIRAILERERLSLPALAMMSRKDFISRMGKAVRQDFRHGRTLRVDGWILSETEAGLCVLATGS